MELGKPKWLEDLDAYRNLKTLFILSGNVHDLQMAEDPIYGCYSSTLDSRLHEYLSTAGYDRIIFYNVIDGFYNRNECSSTDQNKPGPMVESFLKDAGRYLGNDDSETSLESGNCLEFQVAADVIRKAILDGKTSSAIVFDLASSSLRSPNDPGENERKAYTRLLAASKEKVTLSNKNGTQTTNLIIVIVDKVNDLPSWLYVNNPYAKTLSISLPDRFQRRAYAESYTSRLKNTFHDLEKLSEEEKDRFHSDLCNLTEGFGCMELDGFLQRCEARNVSTDDLRSEISQFRYGHSDSTWAHVSSSTIAEAEEIMRQRIKGQDQAIEQALSILIRAASGLSIAGCSRGTSSKPKGILFLAGPTGTGKTELAKAITEALFTDESQMIRFDMSEFSKSQSDQRLFGAPPGYVGYDSGGELTNAVKEKPFSVLLFDEIEKADASIFDKFLQILDDGRLTDSHGETVYFGETLIVFTSNYGLSDRDPLTGKSTNVVKSSTFSSYTDLKTEVLDRIRNPERSIFRPEFVNRIGENIVVFNFISSETAESILRSKLAQFSKNLATEKGINLYSSWAYYNTLLAAVQNNLEMGGRGIVNVLEARFINPLSKTLFINHADPGTSIMIAGEYDGPDKKLSSTLQTTIQIPTAEEGFLLTDEYTENPSRRLEHEQPI